MALGVRKQKKGNALKLGKVERDGILSLNGSEVYYGKGVVLLAYPYVFDKGVKKRLSNQEWKALYKGYWNDDRNEGYWLMKEAKAEFGGK